MGLVRRNHATVSTLLSSVGKLFNAGLQPKVENLYPPISYPVSRGTASLQPLVEWDHTDDWDVITFLETEAKSSGEIVLDVDVENESYNYLKGTFVDGVEVLPYASYLVSFSVSPVFVKRLENVRGFLRTRSMLFNVDNREQFS